MHLHGTDEDLTNFISLNYILPVFHTPLMVYLKLILHLQYTVIQINIPNR